MERRDGEGARGRLRPGAMEPVSRRDAEGARGRLHHGGHAPSPFNFFVLTGRGSSCRRWRGRTGRRRRGMGWELGATGGEKETTPLIAPARAVLQVGGAPLGTGTTVTRGAHRHAS